MRKLSKSRMSAIVYAIFALGMFFIAVFGTNPYVNICLVLLLALATIGGVTLINEYLDIKEKGSCSIS